MPAFGRDKSYTHNTGRNFKAITNCDVVIMATEKNLDILAIVITFCKTNVCPAAIYIEKLLKIEIVH